MHLRSALQYELRRFDELVGALLPGKTANDPTRKSLGLMLIACRNFARSADAGWKVSRSTPLGTRLTQSGVRPTAIACDHASRHTTIVWLPVLRATLISCGCRLMPCRVATVGMSVSLPATAAHVCAFMRWACKRLTPVWRTSVQIISIVRQGGSSRRGAM
jgi:hypothetical protein